MGLILGLGIGGEGFRWGKCRVCKDWGLAGRVWGNSRDCVRYGRDTLRFWEINRGVLLSNNKRLFIGHRYSMLCNTCTVARFLTLDNIHPLYPLHPSAPKNIGLEMERRTGT